MRSARVDKSNCEGKQRFASAVDALQVVRSMTRRHDNKLNTYRCEHCRGWHIGSHLTHRNLKGRAA